MTFIRISSCLLALIFVMACASKSMVVSEPSGAKITVSEKEFGVQEKTIGVTPCTIEGRPFQTYYIKAEKPGFEPSFKTVKAKEIDGERAALGCCACGVPGLLGAGLVLPEEIHFSLRPVDLATTPPAPSGVQPAEVTIPDSTNPEGTAK